MFNLLIIIGPSEYGWHETGNYSFDRERVMEYSDDDESVVKYRDNIKLRRELPCLFSYEGINEYGRIGRISEISKRGSNVDLTYSLDPRFPAIPIHSEDTYRMFGCGRWEKNRTHWAVKNIDLFETVLEIISGGTTPIADASGTRMDELWGDASLRRTRVFLSHRAQDRKSVSAVADRLRERGHKTFVAHDDIRATKQWRNEILYALNTMTHFVGLITDDFHEGSWTDQEIGYAFARTDVKRIFVKLADCDPRGLASFEQAAKSDWDGVAARIDKLVEDDR